MTQAVACYRDIVDVTKNGNRITYQNRIEFFDPHIERPDQGKLLHLQVKRWKKPENVAIIHSEYSSTTMAEIRGIRVHHLAIHILSEILKCLSLGYICKTIKVKLGKTTKYINLNSYNHWRELNGDALNALGIIIKSPLSQMPKARIREIETLVKTLSTQQSDRKACIRSISLGRDPFEIAARALSIADQRIALTNKKSSSDLQQKIRYELAAFYILVVSQLDSECGLEVLRISNEFFTYNSNFTQEIEELLLDENSKESRFKKVLVTDQNIDSSTFIFINTKPDLFSSVNHPNDPITAKHLLNQIVQSQPLENIYKRLANFIVSPLIKQDSLQLENEQERELHKYIKGMGQALADQFTSQNIHEIILSALRPGFITLAKEKLFNYETVHEFGRVFSTLAAWLLLSKAKTHSEFLKSETINTVVCYIYDLVLSFSFPEDRLVDPKTKKIYYPPYLTPLSGQLPRENDTHGIATADEILDCVNKLSSLQPRFKKIVEQLVINRRLNAQKNPQDTIQKTTQEIWEKVDKNFMDLKFFEHLVRLAEIIERVGTLIHNRYWVRYSQVLCDSITYKKSGIIKRVNLSKHNRICRTPEEHKKYINKYFKDISVRHLIDQSLRKKMPRFSHEEKIPPVNEPVYKLFHVPNNNNKGNGNCCPAALSQATFGNYQIKESKWKGKDYSYDAELHEKIRKAVCEYMKDHIEEIIPFVCCTPDESPKEAIFRRIKEIDSPLSMRLDDATWFGPAELQAFSSIVGRPIYCAIAGQIKVDDSGKIQMDKFNDHFKTEPIFLFHQGIHYDCLIRKRIGTKMIAENASFQK